MQGALVLARLTGLNLLWLLCCIPIVTAGPSTASMYYAANQMRLGDNHFFRNFKAGWKKHWKQALPVGILFVILIAVFYYGYTAISENNISNSKVILFIAMLCAITLIMTMLWEFPIMINFSGSFLDLIFNAFIFAFMYAPYTVVQAVLILLWGYAVTHTYIIAVIVSLFAGALIAYLSLLMDETAFSKYRQPSQK
jgi:uncharacterized membrane protein YesL